MKIEFHSPNAKIFDDQKKYIEKKVPKLAKYFDKIDDPSSSAKIQIEKASSKNPKENFLCTVTLFIPGGTLRASHIGETVEASFDLVFDSLKIQIEKKKGKTIRNPEPISEILDYDWEEEIIEPEDNKVKITKRKRFSNAKPMSEEEAIRLMEVSNHDFWLFLNAKTSRFSVVYKRKKEGEYAVLEPKMPIDKR